MQKRRILSLDGGGIRGFFTLGVLARMESLLRQHYQRKDLVLADHFDFVAGTSTGAIIGTLLAWGEPVARVQKLYEERSAEMFQKMPWWRMGVAKYRHEGLAEILQSYFAEDDGSPALLGTSKLKTMLMCVMRNASRGSAWPVTNNPKAKFNARFNADGSPHLECNLNIPLWQLVRGSAAAPWYFPPEEVYLGGQRFVFVDGAVTPYNNPSVMAVLQATLPAYRVEWPAGPEQLLLVSVGTGTTRTVLPQQIQALFQRLSIAMTVPGGLMDTIGLQQDLMCRVLGKTLFGAPIDMELDTLMTSGLLEPAEKKFSYVRYNRFFTQEEVEAVKSKLGHFAIDNLALVPLLREAGEDYAKANVRIEHLV